MSDTQEKVITRIKALNESLEQHLKAESAENGKTDIAEWMSLDLQRILALEGWLLHRLAVLELSVEAHMRLLDMHSKHRDTFISIMRNHSESLDGLVGLVEKLGAERG